MDTGEIQQDLKKGELISNADHKTHFTVKPETCGSVKTALTSPNERYNKDSRGAKGTYTDRLRFIGSQMQI